MLNFDKEYFNLGYLDTLSYRQTFIHNINPVVKLIVTLIFIIAVVSLPKYEISRLIPFFIFPVFLLTAGDIPLWLILKKIIVVSPFVFFAGIFNPLLDTTVLYEVFGISVSGGWISFASIMIKFTLTLSSALLLIATTSFPGICFGLERLHVPNIFVMQLLFIYRYLFVLAEEAMKIVRARNMRSFDKHGSDIKIFINITGTFLLRSIERSGRIYHAICSRGFDGRIRLLRDIKFSIIDAAYALVSITVFMIFRNCDIVQLVGNIAIAF